MAVLLCGTVFTMRAADWLQYRGSSHDGISLERITTSWTGSVTNPVWLTHLTNGLTSLTVSGGRVFTQIGTDTDADGYPDKEFCLALNLTNAGVLWSTEVESAGSPLYPDGGVGFTDDGPRSTPVIENGLVYVLSSRLKLHCLRATNGAVVWSTNLLAGFGGSVIAWQNAASPVLENGLVYVNANCGTLSLMAFNATNGTLVWRSQNEAMTHATPVLATIHGVRQLIFATQSGLVSVNPETGARIWKHSYPFGYSTSIAASPAVWQDYVFLSAFYGMGAFAVQIIATNSSQTAVQRWSNSALQNHWSTPVCYQGAVIGQFTPDSSAAQLRCIDLATGATRWTTSGIGRGGVLLVGTNLLIITEQGHLVLAAASTNAYTEFARFRAIPGYNGSANKCWNAIAVSDGNIYIRSTAYAARFDFSVPDVKLDAPAFSADTLSLAIRTVTGAPLDSNRLANMEVRASTNATLPAAQWTKLTNSFVLTNGFGRVTNLDASLPQRFFIVSEPK